MRVAVYVRVSTSRQVKLQTIEQQLERVRKHVREEGWELSDENVFRDDGYSGTTLKRPALDALRDKVRMREFAGRPCSGTRWARQGNPFTGGKMTEASRQPKDKNYNLISVLYHSSDNVESLKTYIQDAEQEGDQELADFFGGILENNLRAAQSAKEMLVARLHNEQE